MTLEEQAAKRKRLGLSVHLPYGIKKEDGYLSYMDDKERERYLAACDSLRKGRAERESILSTSPTGRGSDRPLRRQAA